MKWNTLLASAGYKRTADGKYFDPITERKVQRVTALNRSSQLYGYKNYASAKEAFSSRAYKRIVSGGYKTKQGMQESFAKQAGVPNDYRLQKLFADAWKARNKECSKELAQLLKYVQKINKYKAVYCVPL